MRLLQAREAVIQPSTDEDMVNGYLIWKTIYRSYDELPPAN
ncbi:MAG: hypothetical protein VYB15_00585 [Planctomycetota bacterium]|nr:hypothetical protein [Planctomycetota bacterium]